MKSGILQWLNEYLGPLEIWSQNGVRPIAESSFLHEAPDRILGPILLPARTKATFGKDAEEMLRQRLTFALKDRALFLEEQKAPHDAWRAEMEALIEGQNTTLRHVVMQAAVSLRARTPGMESRSTEST